MTLFFKLLIATGVTGTAIAVPTILTLKNQKISITGEKDQKRFLEEATDESQERDIGYSVTLPEEQVDASGAEESVKLCKELVRSDEHNGRLMVCRSGKEDSKVKFNYIADLVADTYPYEVTGIRFTYNSIVAELKEELEYSNSRWFSSNGEILSDKGLIQLNKSASRISPNDCKIEWLSSEKSDWKVRCEIN